MATRQIVVRPDELQIVTLAHLNVAIGRLQAWDLDELEKELARVGELILAIKEAVSVLPKPTNSAAEGKRA